MLEQNLLGVLLCGGLSTRLGQNKALLKLTKATPTILERTYQLLSSCLKDCVLMTRSAQLSVLNELKLPYLLDECVRIGPMGGIIRALHFAKLNNKAGILVVPCDMPFLCTRVIEQLIISYHQLPATILQIVWCHSTQQIWQNLTAVYKIDTLELFEQALAKNNFSLRHVVPKAKKWPLYYTSQEEQYFYNINTQTELVHARLMQAEQEKV